MHYGSIGFVSLSFMACSSDNVIKKQENIAPTILIVSHSDGAEVKDGFAESFRATVSDDDNEFEELTVAWYVGENIVCDWEPATSSGESTCDVVFVEGDNSIIAEVRDVQGSGARFELSIEVQPTEAPIVELLTPLSTENHYSDQLIQFSALVSDAEDSSEDLVALWSSSVDGELSLDTTIDSGGGISDYTYLTEGNHAIELRVEDSTGKFSTEDVVIQVGGPNSVPTCSITEPVDGLSYVIGESITFRGIAEDLDIPSNQLQIEWSSNRDGVFDTTSASSDGSVSFIYSELSVNDHTISLNVSDEVGAVCTSQILLSVGNPPVVSIDEPLAGAVYAVGETVTFRGNVSDSEDQSSQIAIVWTSDIEGELQSGNPNSQGVSQFTRSDLSAGVHSVSLSATDTTGLISDDLLSFRINTLPVVDTLSISPAPAYSNTSLMATSVTSDADGQSVTTTYTWYENGVLTSIVGSTVNASELDVGETWMVRATPNDGFQDGVFVEQSISITNTAPTINTPVITPSTGITANSLLTCVATGNDVDDGVLTATYAWASLNGSSNNAPTWQLTPAMVSETDTITCTATVTDSNGEIATSSSSVSVSNTAPQSTSISISPNSNVVTDSMLTCSAAFSDLEDGALTPVYEWTNAGNLIANGATYMVSSADSNVGDSIVCTASVTDSDGNLANDTISVVVSNTNPTVSNVSISPSSSVMNDAVLTCSATVDDIDESVTGTYTWLQNGVAFASGSGVDLSNYSIYPNDTISCEVAVMDSNGGTDSASETVNIGNRSPVVSSVSIDNTAPEINDTITCSATSTDPDGETPTLSYTWMNGSANLGSGGSLLLNSNVASVGDVIECIVDAEDGLGATDSSSTTATVVFSCGLTDCDANLDLGGGLSMDFVLVPNGTFTMGSPTTEVGRQSDEVQHEVTLSNDFYVQTTEVTQGMFAQLMGYEAYAGQNSGHGFGSDYPAFNVSWNMAAACANATTQRENLVHGSTLQECYSCSGSGTSVVCSQSMNPYQCDGYRLLTEAEWEYAARAETATAFWSPNGGGDLPAGFTNTTNILTDGFDLNLYAWNMMISSGQYSTIEVATLLPNDYGLYDMSGNLWEWTQDWYAPYPSGPITDPVHTTSGSYRVFRGGDYTVPPSYLRSAERYYNYQDVRQAGVGFRLARQP